MPGLEPGIHVFLFRGQIILPQCCHGYESERRIPALSINVGGTIIG
jgi:hypothetical protein